MVRKTFSPLEITPFKESKVDFWVGTAHYRVEGKKILFCTGGVESEKAIKELEKYLEKKLVV